MTDNPAWDAISDMEPGVLDIQRWGHVVRSMAGADEPPREALIVVAYAIIGLGEQLEAQWEAALTAARSEGAR